MMKLNMLTRKYSQFQLFITHNSQLSASQKLLLLRKGDLILNIEYKSFISILIKYILFDK